MFSFRVSKKFIILKIFISLFSLNQCYSQFDQRFDPLDWVLYRQLGEITSITEGFRYFYIGTAIGGAVRIQTIGYSVDEPITTMQGLKSNEISAVHFDRNTGNLWILAGNYIHSSHDRVGNWYINEVDHWGMPRNSKILRMGSSNTYVWVHFSSGYVKLDHISGIFLGAFPSPDEEQIQWSSCKNFKDNDDEFLSNYTWSQGWMSMGDLNINPYGTQWKRTVFLVGELGDVVVGMEDGTLFIGNKNMKILEPISAGLGNRDVQFILDDDALILGGRYYQLTQGITYFYPRRGLMAIQNFEEQINLSTNHLFCAIKTENEIWFGGNGFISVYDKKEDFWRTLDETRGFSGNIVTDMAADSHFVWIATSTGIYRMNQQDKRIHNLDFEQFFDQMFIYDIELINDQLWIATHYNLAIIDLKSKTVKNHKNIGQLGTMLGMEDLLFGFKVIKRFKNEVMVSSSQGVWSFDLQNQTWKELINPAVYAGYEITDMERNEHHIFIATNKGFIRYDFNGRFIHDYHYDMIGYVYDMHLENENLWLGTANGLVKFKWTKD